MTFNPFEEHEDYMRRKEEVPGKVLRKGLALGSAAIGGHSLISRILPLLSDKIPEEIARKGIGKVSPKLGEFVESATNLGHDFYEIRDYIRAKASEEQEGAKKPADSRNVIQQYSPELHQYISEEIQKGRSPIEAGALASLQGNFKNIIKKLTDDHQAPFASILETVYGGQGGAKKPRSELSRESLLEQFNQGQGGGAPQGKQALLQTMQEITQALQRMRTNG